MKIISSWDSVIIKVYDYIIWDYKVWLEICDLEKRAISQGHPVRIRISLHFKLYQMKNLNVS